MHSNVGDGVGDKVGLTVGLGVGGGAAQLVYSLYGFSQNDVQSFLVDPYTTLQGPVVYGAGIC